MLRQGHQTRPRPPPPPPRRSTHPNFTRYQTPLRPPGFRCGNARWRKRGVSLLKRLRCHSEVGDRQQRIPNGGGRAGDSKVHSFGPQIIALKIGGFRQGLPREHTHVQPRHDQIGIQHVRRTSALCPTITRNAQGRESYPCKRYLQRGGHSVPPGLWSAPLRGKHRKISAEKSEKQRLQHLLRRRPFSVQNCGLKIGALPDRVDARLPWRK